MTKQLLQETFWVDPTRLEESGKGFIKKLTDGRYRVRAKGQHAGIKNKNGRIYPREVWEAHTRPDCAFMKKVRCRRVVGQVEHPKEGRSSMDKGAVVITEVSPPDSDGEVYITFETMSTPDGKVVSSYIKDNVGFGLSSRGNGTTITTDEADVVQDDYEPITWDTVIDESTPHAEVAARAIRESRERTLAESGGDVEEAVAIALRETEDALARDQAALTDTVAPLGFSEFLLSTPDEQGHYRAYQVGTFWDVWLHIHNLEPELVAKGLQTLTAAKDAAEAHLQRVVGEAALSVWGGPIVADTEEASKYSKKASEFIGKEIKKLVTKGPSGGPEKGKKYPEKRAVGAAMAIARKKGMKVPPKKTESIDERLRHRVVCEDCGAVQSFPPHLSGGDIRRSECLACGEVGTLRVVRPGQKIPATAQRAYEAYSIASMAPLVGSTIVLDQFNNRKEAEQAHAALGKVGFLGVDITDDDTVVINTGYEDPEQGIAQIRRVLSNAGIELMEESEMARLRIVEQGSDIEEYADEGFGRDEDIGVPVYQITAGAVALAEQDDEEDDEDEEDTAEERYMGDEYDDDYDDEGEMLYDYDVDMYEQDDEDEEDEGEEEEEEEEEQEEGLDDPEDLDLDLEVDDEYEMEKCKYESCPRCGLHLG